MKHIWIIGIGIICSMSAAQAQKNPITAYDLFFDLFEGNDRDIESLFTKSGRISTVYYDTTGRSALRSFSPREYGEQLESIDQTYRIQRTPQVLINREYGSVARIYSTVTVELTDRNTGETLLNNTIQSVQLIKVKGQWKINHISIQSEHPLYPINPKMLPRDNELVMNNESSVRSEDFETLGIPDFSTDYDTNKVYRVDEVDELPFYPGDGELFLGLKKTYGVVDRPTVGYTPFIVTIMEDGLAELTYVHDLSGFQIAQAESFVRSMLIWYPAVKYAASVKCKIVFYIRE